MFNDFKKPGEIDKVSARRHRDRYIYDEQNGAEGMALVNFRDPVGRTASSWRKYVELFHDGRTPEGSADPCIDFDAFVAKHGLNIPNLHILFRRGGDTR